MFQLIFRGLSKKMDVTKPLEYYGISLWDFGNSRTRNRGII